MLLAFFARGIIGGMSLTVKWKADLAKLKEDPQDVKAWARGTREAPLSVYIKALDLLANAARNKEKS